MAHKGELEARGGVSGVIANGLEAVRGTRDARAGECGGGRHAIRGILATWLQAPILQNYFDNEAVEALLTRYVDGACTDIKLRDEIMEHALPLIRNVILSSGHHKLLQYQHGSNVDDLVAVAWAQVEKTLYKYEPGRGKVFSLWTQIVYTVCMAYVKKETRDAVNVRGWRDGHPAPLFEKRRRPDFYGIMAELREAVPEDYQEMVDALVEIYEEEAQPWIGLISKLTRRGYSRRQAREFLGYLSRRESQDSRN